MTLSHLIAIGAEKVLSEENGLSRVEAGFTVGT
jgi:hypothetical protein